jgi:hypothetical protein
VFLAEVCSPHDQHALNAFQRMLSMLLRFSEQVDHLSIF